MTSTKSLLAALFLVAISGLLASSSAFDDPRELESLRVRMDFNGTADIAGTADLMKLSIYKVPRGGNCTVPIETDSEGKDFVSFSWKSPGSSASYDYGCTSVTGRDGPNLLRDEPMPSGNFGNYTAASELVLITPEIASKAQALIGGVDGEFLAASILSNWVHDHMKYDKSYFGRVLDSRQIFTEMTGVCEEYSHLLLAMLRSVGVPSRYVTGFVYGKDGWDPHAWVEVYFPQSGVWIPFDPTYNENGYVDASHIRFFDSLDGSFAALRTSFTYNAFGQKPSIDWDEPNPKVTVDEERLGYELLKVNVPGEEQAVRIGKYALVRADVENNAGTLLYPEMRLAYLARNLDDATNLELAYGNETVSFVLLPGERKSAYWVLKAKSRYTISPKVVAENGVFDAGNISGVEYGRTEPELELFSDKDGYAKSGVARLTVTNKGASDAVLTELTTGVSRAVSAGGGRAEFEVPAAGGEAAVYSSSGDLAKISLPVYESGLDARLSAPDRVVAGRPFEVVISSPNPTLRMTAAVGNKSFGGSGFLRLNYTLSESGALSARVFDDAGETEVLRKYVEVVPAPEITLSQAAASRPYLNLTIAVKNGGLSFARVLSGRPSRYESLSDSSGRLTFTDDSAKCGKRLELRVEVTSTDLLGGQNTGNYDASAKVRCGFFETLIQNVLDFFLTPFLAQKQ